MSEPNLTSMYNAGKLTAEEFVAKFGPLEAAMILNCALVHSLCKIGKITTVTEAIDFWRLITESSEGLIRAEFGKAHYG
jgi:hypothetical protein